MIDDSLKMDDSLKQLLLAKGYKIHEDTRIPISPDDPPTLKMIKEYTHANMQYGHFPKDWNPKMAPYIICEKYGYHIFDLVKTSQLLGLAEKVVQKAAEKGKKFLFVGTTKIASSIIASQAKNAQSFYINYRWLGGMLTNWSTIQNRIERLQFLENQELTGEFLKLSKKEYSAQRKELDKLKRLFNGIKEMKTLPDYVIFVTQLKDKLAILECLKLGIPSISIVDTNCDPDLVPYLIPANDDNTSSIRFVLEKLVAKIQAGQEIFNANQASKEQNQEEQKEISNGEYSIKTEHNGIFTTKGTTEQTSSISGIIPQIQDL